MSNEKKCLLCGAKPFDPEGCRRSQSDCRAEAKYHAERERELEAQIEWLKKSRARLAKENRILDLSAQAMAEIKATIDGSSDQPVKDIVYGCLEEIKILANHEQEKSNE